MQNPSIYSNWQELLAAPHSSFFAGHTSDTVFDRAANTHFRPSTEALFTQSNARVLLGQAASGSLRFVSLPTQVYPAPPQTSEFGLGPGMYHHFDVAMYTGDLSYHIQLNGSGQIDLAADERDNQTVYADHFLPLTRADAGDLKIALIGFAPVAPDSHTAPLSPAPLPGPAGAIYVLYLHNQGPSTLKGKVVLQASDQLIGDYGDMEPEHRALKRPAVDVHHHTLILTRPNGAVGVHLHDGRWTKMEVPFQAERAFSLKPGEEMAFETHVALGSSYAEILPTIYALHLRSALDWLNLTADFWRSRLGSLDVGDVEEAAFSRDIYIRSLFDNFNCLQADAEGNVIAHWQGAPSHGYGTVWGIDVEPTAVSIVHVCPELARQTMLFFLTRSRVPKGPPDHSTNILVAPVVIARQWLQVTGDVDYLKHHPEVIDKLQDIMRDLLALKSPEDALFASRYSSDGPVGRRYDYGTNVKVWYTFDSMAYLLSQLDRSDEARQYREKALAVQDAITRHMIADGPFGPQISGGTNLGEEPGTFYLPEGVCFYDGEDTSSMLAPIYGIGDFSDKPWANYHRFARSLWCPSYDPEFDVLLWNPAEPGIVDGTAYFSRLGGSLTRAEMRDGLAAMRQWAVDEVTGSIFWWPHGEGNKRALTRCSQGQGAWAWQYLYQWLGLQVDACAHTLTFAPQGLLTHIDWRDFCAGPHQFDVHWIEHDNRANAHMRNHNDTPWTIRVGFRGPGTGADSQLDWQTQTVKPGEEITLTHIGTSVTEQNGLDRRDLAKRELSTFGEDGIIFRRYGPAIMWTNWFGWGSLNLPDTPLALRFVVVNGTGVDWSSVSVVLNSPQGWMAEGHQPGHYAKPEHAVSGQIRLSLGSLPASGRTVAGFWLRGECHHRLITSWNKTLMSFHATSQPDNHITLYTEEPGAREEAIFSAELTATAADGSTVRRSLTVPLRILGQP